MVKLDLYVVGGLAVGVWTLTVCYIASDVWQIVKHWREAKPRK